MEKTQDRIRKQERAQMYRRRSTYTSLEVTTGKTSCKKLSMRKPLQQAGVGTVRQEQADRLALLEKTARGAAAVPRLRDMLRGRGGGGGAGKS